MEELKKLGELIDHFKSGIGFLNTIIKDSKDKAAKLNAKESELDSRVNDLSKRESKIGSAEEVINMREQVVKDRAEAEKLLRDARIEAQKIAEKIKADSDDLEATKKKVAIDSKKSKDEMIMIQKEWKGLEKEQKTWKDKFYEDLKKKEK